MEEGDVKALRFQSILIRQIPYLANICALMVLMSVEN